MKVHIKRKRKKTEMVRLYKNGVSCENIIKFRNSVESIYGVKPVVNLINAHNSEKVDILLNKSKSKPSTAANDKGRY